MQGTLVGSVDWAEWHLGGIQLQLAPGCILNLGATLGGLGLGQGSTNLQLSHGRPLHWLGCRQVLNSRVSALGWSGVRQLQNRTVRRQRRLCTIVIAQTPSSDMQ